MELRHLRYAVAVAHELHFGRAAQRVHVAQSSLSQQIAQLERELGVVLFDRSSRRVALTEAGAVFVAQAQRVIADADLAVRDARRAARGEIGTLTLAFVDSAAYALLPPLLSTLHERLPDLRVALREVSTETDLDDLAATVDVAILRDVARVAGMTTSPLLDERLVVAAPRDHRLAGAARLRLADLDDVDLVFPHHDLAANVHQRLRVICAAAGLHPRIAHLALQYPTMLGLVAAGYGLALVPAAVAILRHPGVAFVPLADADATTSLVLGVADGSDAPAVRVTVDIARSAARTLAG